jgi:hypothetical protein
VLLARGEAGGGERLERREAERREAEVVQRHRGGVARCGWDGLKDVLGRVGISYVLTTGEVYFFKKKIRVEEFSKKCKGNKLQSY